MRASQWLLGLATAGAMVGMVAAGCGGSSQQATPADSGADVTTDTGAPDTAAEAAMEAAAMDTGMACAVDADITMLNVPDAAIGDSGASTDQCYACIQSTCPQQLSACNADCSCKTEVVDFLNCVASGMSITTCGTPLVTGGSSAGLPLVGCIGGSASGIGSGPGCLKECGVTIPEGGIPSDAGVDSASADASAD